MTVLVTGCAGFIGMHVARALLERGQQVIGLDNLNDYYDPRLKQARLAKLREQPGFTFHQGDIADGDWMNDCLAAELPALRAVVHLAAQAGVRHSLERPFAYLHSNLAGHLAILELCRHLPRLEHLVYASSSSVYGGNRKVPFAVEDAVDQPLSLYAATKRADELMSGVYTHLFALPQTGLRFFTVYGPWGRPDMAYYSFTDAILCGRPISLFNEGRMRRDFTYIDDIVEGVLAALDRAPAAPQGHRIYNLGSNEPVELEHFVAVLEKAVGRTAVRQYAAMQPGDVTETFADIETTTRDLGWRPKTRIEDGLANFVAWYRAFAR